MRKQAKGLLFGLVWLIVMLMPPPAFADEPIKVYLPLVQTPTLGVPVLKWAYGGCYSSWCETGWYSSPAAVDIDGDGRNEVIASAYSLWALNGENGSLIWRAGSTAHRTWPGVAVADIDLDGQQEIVIAQSGAVVSVYRLNGTLKWNKTIDGGKGELRGLLVADLDGNLSTKEVVVTRAYGSAKNTWVLDSNGEIRPGWPQLPADNDNVNGYGWGVYNDNAAAGDIDGDGKLELVVPSDVHYINVYKPDGSPVAVNSGVYPGKKWWGQVGIWESLVPEKRGWGKCDRSRIESYRANFADGPAVIADVNGDGQREIVVTGNMYDCYEGYPPSQYMAAFIFNADRTRFRTGGFDWSMNPIDTGSPLSEDYDVIESAEPNPVVADLDGDGNLEILYASYDGRLHAFWLDRTEHGSWPYSVNKPSEGFFRFASEPLVADLDDDGRAEVIFTSWTQKGSFQYGQLHILSSDGKIVFIGDLPNPRSGNRNWNGSMAAPTLANIDNDPDLELIINTVYSGVVAYDLPGTASAKVQWGTGRGSFQRDGYR